MWLLLRFRSLGVVGRMGRMVDVWHLGLVW